MNRAVDDGWITALPTLNLRPLKWTATKQTLLPRENIERLCEVAVKDKTFKNGREFADYVKLMAACGARRDETLRLKWSDMDWERRQLTVGSDGMAKNRKARVVDFNAELEAHLKAMVPRRAPDSQWLFPSPQRGGPRRSGGADGSQNRSLRVSRSTALLHQLLRDVGGLIL